jgi:hypothetical protein
MQLSSAVCQCSVVRPWPSPSIGHKILLVKPLLADVKKEKVHEALFQPCMVKPTAQKWHLQPIQIRKRREQKLQDNTCIFIPLQS